MCRASTCHTHPSVRLGESSWRLWIQDHRRHFLTCVEGFGDITPCYVIMRTGCIWSVCGHRLLSGSERRDKDVASRPASSSANLWGEESVCESIPTCAYLCMTRVRAVLSCTQCTGFKFKSNLPPSPKTSPSTDCNTKDGAEHLLRWWRWLAAKTTYGSHSGP